MGMTGQPSFRFRGGENPECTDCGIEMVLIEEEAGVYGDRDRYGCADCGSVVVDRWSY